MSVELTWAVRARRDLVDIQVWMGMHNPAAADRVYKAIVSRALALREAPFVGRRRPEIDPKTRSVVVKPYLILYRTNPDARTDDESAIKVEIVRVVHGSRRLNDLF